MDVDTDVVETEPVSEPQPPRTPVALVQENEVVCIEFLFPWYRH